MEVAPRRKAPRKRKAREPEDEVQIVPVGDHATLLGLPTEILDDIARLLILSHPRHALEFGLSSKLLHLLVRGSLGWKIIVDAAGLKVPKVTKAVTFPYLTAVSRGWPKLCWGCHMVKKDRVPVEYRLGDPILLCAACRVARYDPASDPPDNEGPIRARISKSKAKEQFKLADRDLIGLEHGPRGYFYSDVRDVARRLHGGDVGIRAVVGFSNERKKQLRETRLEKQQERERIAVENRKRRRTALQERLDQLGLQIPETNTIYRSFVDGYSLYGAPPRNRGRLFDSATDPQFQDTVNRLVNWDRARKERLRTLPAELEKHGLEYSVDSAWCSAYVDQNEYTALSLEKVVRQMRELKWFFEKTEYRKARFGEAAENVADRNYLNDDDAGYYTHIHRPAGLRSVSEAQTYILKQLIDKRFNEDKKTPVTATDPPFDTAPPSIIDRVNAEIERKLNPPAYLPMVFPFDPFGGFGGYDDYSDYGSDDGEDICSIM